MQVTIAQQLDLEVSTVANFFMNARRRSVDKWQDDNEFRPNDSPSPSRSVDAGPSSPAQPTQAPSSSSSHPSNLQNISVPSSSSIDPLLASQVLQSDSLSENPLLSSSNPANVDFNDSPTPSLTPDAAVTSSLALPGSDLPTQVSVSGGILVTTSAPADTNATNAVPQLLTHSVQLLPGGQSAILINAPLDTGDVGSGGGGVRDDTNSAAAAAAAATTCLISGLPVSLDSLFPATSTAVSGGQNIFRTEPPPDPPNPGLVLPSASTLIGPDRGIVSTAVPGTSTSSVPPLRRIKQEGPLTPGPPTHVTIPINPKK